jgi:hypothetical protein
MAKDDLVEALEEGDRLQVLASTVTIRDPLSGRARVVQIEHGGDRIHSESVHVIPVEPEQRVADEEVRHFVSTVIEDQGAPLGMLSLPRVRVLVEMRAVEEGEAVGVPRKVGRDPVQDDADAVPVEAVDEVHEVLRRAVAARRGEVAEDLVAPGAVERVLRDGHELDVGVAHVAHVGSEPLGELAVPEEAMALLGHPHPGAEVHLVDGDRAVRRLPPLPLRHPRGIIPGVAVERPDHRGRSRRLRLEGERVGIRLERQHLAPCRQDLELVPGTGADARDEDFPDAVARVKPHGMPPPIPLVEVAHHAHPPRVRGPHGEGHPGDAVHLPLVRPEPFVGPVVGPLA